MALHTPFFLSVQISDFMQMQTHVEEIPSADIQAVRDFLMGATDEVKISSPRPAKPYRPTQQSQPSVPVSQGISRGRIRSARSN